MAELQKPQTFNGDLANLPVALERLTAEARWVVWRWQPRRKKSGELERDKNGSPKWTKPPFRARYPGQFAKSDDPDTWGSYSDAVAAVEHGDANGIGYALLGSDVGAIDLDKCRDPTTGR